MIFYVKGQTLTRAGKETIATEAVNFPTVEFIFDSSWDGVGGITALFQNVNTIFNAVTPASAAGNTAYAVVLTSLGDGRYSCVVPHEVLEGEEAKKFIVTVFGGSVNNKRITTNPVTCEVVPSMYDPGQTPGTPTPALWDQVVDLLEGIDDTVDGIEGDVSDLETEIADARIDTNDTTWPTLGQAIRGQVTGFKNYMQYSGFLAEVTIEEGKRWVENSGHVVLIDPSDSTVSAISAKILYQPTACYIRMRNVNHSGEFTEWWGLNSEEELIQQGTNLVNSRFIFNDLNRGIVEIRFNSDTEKIAAAQVICSNETYGYMYDDNVENIKTTDWLLNNVTTETQIANATANYGQRDITLDPALQIGDLVHIVGTTTGNLPLAMKFYRSGRPIEQKFYDVQKSPTTIDIYVHIENSTLDTFRVWSKYPNHYDITVYKVEYVKQPDVYSSSEFDSGRRGANGEIIYGKTYDLTLYCNSAGDLSSGYVVIENNWPYTQEIIDHEMSIVSTRESRAKHQLVCGITSYFGNGHPALDGYAIMVRDSEYNSHQNNENSCNVHFQYMMMMNSTIASVTLTLFYRKAHYNIPAETWMFEQYTFSGSGSCTITYFADSAGCAITSDSGDVDLLLKGILLRGKKNIKLYFHPSTYSTIRPSESTVVLCTVELFMKVEGEWAPTNISIGEIAFASAEQMSNGYFFDLTPYAQYTENTQNRDFCLGLCFRSYAENSRIAISNIELTKYE